MPRRYFKGNSTPGSGGVDIGDIPVKLAVWKPVGLAECVAVWLPDVKSIGPADKLAVDVAVSEPDCIAVAEPVEWPLCFTDHVTDRDPKRTPFGLAVGQPVEFAD